LAILTWKQELVIVRASGGHPPGPQIGWKGCEQTDRAVLSRLCVGLFAKRDRALNEQSPLADVCPAQPEGFTRTKAGVRENWDQRGVAGAKAAAHCLDRRRRERLDLLVTQTPGLLHPPDCILWQMPTEERVLKDRPEQIHRVTDRDLTWTGR
jgi:hypothetical protein